jgi:hypothetical protein
MPSRFVLLSRKSHELFYHLFIQIGINSLFKKIGCDRRQIEHLLQSHEGVTEDNMLRYLGIIEERTNELLTAQATINAKVND